MGIKRNYNEIVLKMIEYSLIELKDFEPIELNQDLAEELKRVDELCEAVDGSLQSRQVIAFILNNWMLRNPDKKPYNYLHSSKGL